MNKGSKQSANVLSLFKLCSPHEDYKPHSNLMNCYLSFLSNLIFAIGLHY